jgi:hypothetical protein
MARAYKCDGCGELFEGVPPLNEDRTCRLARKVFKLRVDGFYRADGFEASLCAGCQSKAFSQIAGRLAGKPEPDTEPAEAGV